MRAEPSALEQRIDYHFSDPELLRRALTHSSLANEARSGGSPLDDNEQLEFLGDSVLGFLIAEALVRRNPGQTEGELSRQKAHLVSAAHLHGVARRLELGSHLELGRSEEMSGGRAKKTLLVDGLEAVIAAVYLDGGVDAGAQIRPRVRARRAALERCRRGHRHSAGNYEFQKRAAGTGAGRKLPQPRYSIVRERGPEHSKVFTVEVRVGKDWTGQADGRTKKIAAQRAARGVYERLLAALRSTDCRPRRRKPRIERGCPVSSALALYAGATADALAPLINARLDPGVVHGTRRADRRLDLQRKRSRGHPAVEPFGEDRVMRGSLRHDVQAVLPRRVDALQPG